MQLYLNTYGVYLHVKDALFEVRMPQDGGGHQKHHFAAQKVTSIIMTTSGALSTDAIRLALQNNIDIIFADSSGLNQEGTDFCAACHQGAGDAADHLFFIPDPYSRAFRPQG